MVQIITREWEITKFYMEEVVNQEGLVKLDMENFERMTQYYKPAVVVKVSEDMPLSKLVQQAFEEMCKHVSGLLRGIIMVVGYREDRELMMDELSYLYEPFKNAPEADVVWGIYRQGGLTAPRSITLFAFEK